MSSVKDLMVAINTARANTSSFPVVRFNDKIEEVETYLDYGMMATATEFRVKSYDDGENVVEIVFYLAPHEAHNIKFEKANYYDDQGNPTLTAGETGNRPQQREDVYLMEYDEGFFDIVGEEFPVIFLDKESLALAFRGVSKMISILEARVNEATNDPKNHKAAVDELAAAGRALKAFGLDIVK